jgi:hypothetical protein
LTSDLAAASLALRLCPRKLGMAIAALSVAVGYSGTSRALAFGYLAAIAASMASIS